VFPNDRPNELPPKRQIAHRVDLIEGAKVLLFLHTYIPLSEHAYRELESQIDDAIAGTDKIKPITLLFSLFIRKEESWSDASVHRLQKAKCNCNR